MTRRYSNVAAQTTLASGVTASDTTIPVSSTSGFPAVDFVLALDYGTASQELVLVTGVAGTTLTVTRGYDSTPATAHDAGAVVVHTHSAADFADSRTHEAATANVHGITGGFVGTTDAQVLSNKDLTASSNSFPNTLALASDLNEVSLSLNNHTASTAAHGATGANVGTTNVQTLTNKTLSTGTKIGAGTELSGAWTTYVPTLTNITLANGTVGAAYIQVGKLVTVRFLFNAGSNTTYPAGTISVSLPVAAKSIYVDPNWGSAIGVANVSCPGSNNRQLAMVVVGGDGAARFITASGTVTNTVPGAWGSASSLSFTVTYEAA